MKVSERIANDGLEFHWLSLDDNDDFMEEGVLGIKWTVFNPKRRTETDAW